MSRIRTAAAHLLDTLACALHWAQRPAGRLTQPTKARYVYLLAFLLPFTLVGIFWMCHGVIPFLGDRMILAHDQWHQYYPFFLDLRDKLQNGGSLFYSWTTGMGTNYLSLLAYYLASPFNFLAVLVPESMLLGYYTLCVLIRIGCAGLCFAVLLRRWCLRKDACVAVFSTGYALCAFIMGYYWNAIWLDTVALLPLVVLGTFRLLRDKQYVLYTLTLALSILCSYYMGLFTCIFVFLLFFVYNICNWDDLGGFGSRLLRIAFFSVLAIGMTAFLSLPAYQGLRATSSSENQFPTTFATNINKDATFLGVLDAVRQVISNLGAGITPTSMEGLPNIYCGVVSVVLAMLFFCCKRINLREKLCCVLLLLFFTLSFIIRQADYVLHGCHFPNMLPYRYSFLFSFVLLWMAYRAFTQLDRFRWYHLICILPLLGGFVYCVASAQDALSIVLTCVILVLTLMLLVLYGTRRLSRRVVSAGLCAFLLVELTVGAFLGVNTVSTTVKTSYPKASADVQTLLAKLDAREEETLDRFRTEVTRTQSLNDDALNGFNGVSTFSSAANSRVSQLLKTLGIGASVAGNRYVYQQADPFTNLLLGIKYLIDREGEFLDPAHFSMVSSSGEVLLLENDYYLPMGFMVPDTVLDYDAGSASESDIYGNLNALYQNMGGTGKLFSSLEIAEPQAQGDLVLTNFSNSYFKMDGADSDGSAISTVVIPYDCELCLYLRTWSCQDVTLRINGETQDTYSVSYGYNCYLGALSAGDEVTVEVSPKAGKTGYLRIGAAAFRSELFGTFYNTLQTKTLSLTAVSDTSLEGYIRAPEAGVLYTSIPCDAGWSVKVDGRSTSFETVGGAFLAVRLEPGYHSIILQYETPGFAPGCKISLLCLAVFLLLALIALLRRLTHPTLRTVQVELEDAPKTPPETELTGSMPPLELLPEDDPAPPDAPDEGKPDAQVLPFRPFSQTAARLAVTEDAPSPTESVAPTQDTPEPIADTPEADASETDAPETDMTEPDASEPQHSSDTP